MSHRINILWFENYFLESYYSQPAAILKENKRCEKKVSSSGESVLLSFPTCTPPRFI